jgi:hypothetical protein
MPVRRSTIPEIPPYDVMSVAPTLSPAGPWRPTILSIGDTVPRMVGWVSTLIDLAIVAIAVTVFFVTRRRGLRLIAAAVVIAGLVAAIMAPIVMTDDSDGRMEPDNAPMMTP